MTAISQCPIGGAAPARPQPPGISRIGPVVAPPAQPGHPSSSTQPASNPLGAAVFNYAEALNELDFAASSGILHALMTDSQGLVARDWGTTAVCSSADGLAQRPAPIRTGVATCGGGTGNQRFAPINSGLITANFDKGPAACSEPINQKYGQPPLLADLIVLTGNCCPRVDGFPHLASGVGASILATGGRHLLGQRKPVDG